MLSGGRSVAVGCSTLLGDIQTYFSVSISLLNTSS